MQTASPLMPSRSPSELERAANLMELVPKHRTSVLDVGARDGWLSQLLTAYFREVTALDLERPMWTLPGVRTVAGDACKLDFPDNSFDVLFCVEVLEHIQGVEQAARELARVARHEVLVGVPFEQDTRIDRTTCQACGGISPPWGHVNSFTEKRLKSLFPGMREIGRGFVGINRERTNPIAVKLMDWAGNPWGAYSATEPCLHCGARLVRPANRTLLQHACSSVAGRMNRIQSRLSKAHPNWIHVLFAK